jgi:uncharacterized cupredoxin-like copper-binding protein
MKKTTGLIAALFPLILLLTACSSSANKIDVTMTDFKFAPDTATISAGQQITVNARNDGQVGHEFVIFKLGQSAGEKFGPEDEENIFWEVEVDPGKSVTETFTAPAEPGEYYVTCGLEGHLEAGMVGKLIVKK